jgi:hypothetical protein
MKNFSTGKLVGTGFKRFRIEEIITTLLMFLCHGPWIRLQGITLD